MQENKIIPFLLIDKNFRLVKGVNFKNHKYIGDPINTIKLFNDLKVDEIGILNIDNSEFNDDYLSKLREIFNEAFMPVSFGGNINSLQDVNSILKCGAEKIIINTSSFKKPEIVREIVREIGSQSVAISIDVNFINNDYIVYVNNGSENTKINLINYIKYIENLEPGELIITSIEKEGTRTGYDFNLAKLASRLTDIPIIINGGAVDFQDFKNIFEKTSLKGCGATSKFIFFGKFKSVLISYLDDIELLNLRNL
ncbi:HisA/HisF-related TIM barrel protein [Candidatus Pelagibacter bacterium]|nr:HisA/HisF-related TIM barrel protein [Candidatus Pelagibacter bacterium]